ncbi:MAG: aldo/keto reductase [Spirochaetota bacterium]
MDTNSEVSKTNEERTMKYKALGNTGLYVSELTLGTMTFDEKDGAFAQMLGGTGQELANKMVGLSIDAGINIFDTANVYSNGVSETMLGKALGDKRKDVKLSLPLWISDWEH